MRKQVQRAAEEAKGVIPGAEFISVSSVTGEGMDVLVDRIAEGLERTAQEDGS